MHVKIDRQNNGILKMNWPLCGHMMWLPGIIDHFDRLITDQKLGSMINQHFRCMDRLRSWTKVFLKYFKLSIVLRLSLAVIPFIKTHIYYCSSFFVDYNLFDNNIVLPSPLTSELYPPDMEIATHIPAKKRKNCSLVSE